MPFLLFMLILMHMHLLLYHVKYLLWKSYNLPPYLLLLLLLLNFVLLLHFKYVVKVLKIVQSQCKGKTISKSPSLGQVPINIQGRPIGICICISSADGHSHLFAFEFVWHLPLIPMNKIQLLGIHSVWHDFWGCTWLGLSWV